MIVQYYGDDFCLIHGHEAMMQDNFNPIPFCATCEAERMAKEAATSGENISLDSIVRMAGKD